MGSESVSDGTYSTGLGGFLRGLGIPVGVTLSYNESCNNDGGSLALPCENIGEVGTRECTGNFNIFSIAKIFAESWIDTMFVELAGIGLIYLV